MVKKLIFVTFFLFSIGSSYGQVSLGSGKIAEYLFNGNANDGINGMNGSILGVVTLTADRFGNPNSAYEFAGTTINGGDFIRIAHDPRLNFSGAAHQSFSISFWALRVSPGSNDFMIAKGQDVADHFNTVPGSYGFRINTSIQKASFRLGFYNDEASLDSIVNGIWVNYVGSYNDTTKLMQFYEDGVLMAQNNVGDYVVANDFPLVIGRHFTNAIGTGGSSYPFRGKIDDIIIYGRALNSCEAYALSNDISTCFGVNQGLSARYDFCSSAKDASGNGNNGTIAGGAFVDDRFGNTLSAFSVDGISDYMQVANNSSLNLNSQIAISAWYKADALASNTTNPILVKPGTPFDQYQLGVSGNTTDAFSMNMSIGSQNEKVTPLQFPYSWTINTWYHLVGVYDGTSKLTLYVNGKNLNTITVSGSPDTFTQDLLIAANTITGNYLKGTIDDIRIYNRPFYKTDAKALYHLAAYTVTCCSIVSPNISLASICGPGILTFTGVSGNVEPGTIIHWYSTTSSLLGIGKKFISPLVTTAGLFYTSNYYFGCESSQEVAIAIINPIPTVTGLNGSKSVCPNITNIGYGINSVSGTSYKWFTSGGTLVGGISTGDTVGIDWGGANSNAKVKVLPTNTNGCVGDTAIRNVTVNIVLKTETPIGDSIVCLNKSTSLSYQIQPTNGSVYNWTVINAVTVLGPLNTNKITISPTLSGVTKLLITETVPSMALCYGQSDTLRLHVHPSPDTTLSIMGGNGLCISIPGVFSLNGFSSSTYNWTVASGLVIQSQVNNTVTIKSKDSGIPVINLLKVLEISDKGCVGKIYTSTITTGRPFNTNIDSQDTTLCTKMGVNAVYSVSGFDGSSYEWTSDNVSWTPIPDWTSFQTAYMLTVPGTGFLKVKETASTVNVCPGNKDSLFVRVFQSPTNLNIVGRNKFCQNTINEPFSITGLSGSTFVWWVQTTSIKTGQGSDHVTIDFYLPGSYKLTVLEKTNQGCLGDSGAVRKFISVDPNPIAKVINGDSIYCTSQVDSAIFTLKGFYASKYYWEVKGGNAAIIGRQDTSFVRIALDSASGTTRWIKALETSGQGCVGDTVKKFVRIDRPKANIQSVSVSETNEKTIELNYSPSGHYASFVREPGTTLGLLFNTTQYLDNNLLTDSIIYQYQILEKDKCGKVFGSSVQENILLKGRVDSVYGSAKLSWNPYIGWTTGVKEYQIWRMIGDGGSSEQYMTVTDSTTGDFVVANDGPVQIFRIKTIGNDPTRNSLSNPVRMIFNNVPKVYSGFTPNEDGLNDTWIVDRINLYPGNKVTVMDKWGTPVFEKTAYKGEWDGKKNGNDIPAGIYYYIIDLGQGHKPLAGTVSILR